MATPIDNEGSVTRWIDELKAGDPAAAQPLWERYFDRLVRLARRRLFSARCAGASPVEDEEDAALSAFDSFCAGAAQGKFPRLADREDLWKLLVVITARKASAQIDRLKAQKRGGDWSRIAPGASDQDDREGFEIDQIADGEPTPEFAAMVAEQYRKLLEALGDDGLRQVALWKMEGLTSDEIADRLGCARRTVARRIDLIRKIWLEEST